MKHFGHLPKRDETIAMGELMFGVLNADSRRIRLMRVSPVGRDTDPRAASLVVNRARTFWLAGLAGAALPLGARAVRLVAVVVRLGSGVVPACSTKRNRARGHVLGWAFGVGKYGVGASWIYVSIHDYGPAPAWLAGSLVAVFVVAMALVPGGVHVRIRALGARPNRWVNAIGFSACWVALEWMLTWFLTGFPWLFLGYAQLDNPLRHWAPVGGVLLVSLVAALSATIAVAAIARHATRSQRRRLRCCVSGVAVARSAPGSGTCVG